MMGIPMDVLYGRIAGFYQTNQNLLADALSHAASGKRVRNPSDGIPDYFHAERLKNESTAYSGINQEVTEASAMMDVAVTAGQTVYDDLQRMQDIVKLYYDDTTANNEKEGLKAEFDSLSSNVSKVVSNTKFDGKQLISAIGATPLRSVHIDPNNYSQTFDISFSAGQIADSSALALGVSDETTENDAVQAELDKAASYLAQATAYSTGIKAQSSLISTKLTAYKSSESAVTDADMGNSLMEALNREIQNQSTVAMMSQANMFGSLVLKLVGF